MLIAIAIIGIVAALTIPTLVKNYQKKVTVERLKTAYIIFLNAIKFSSEDNGYPTSWDYSNKQIVAEKYVIPYLTGVNKLETKYNVRALNSTQTYWFWQSSSNNQPIYQLRNGMTFTYSTIGGANNRDGVIVVDLNGRKRPNIIGKDGFVFKVLDQDMDERLIDMYCSGYNNRNQILTEAWAGCRKTSGHNNYRGGCCTRLIQRDGWKIADDYPW